MTFRNVVMDRCIETYQHTDKTIHYHNEYTVISSNSSLTMINQSKAYWIRTGPHSTGMKKRVLWVRSPP